MFCSQNNLGSKKSETWKKKILDPKKPRGLKVFKRSQDYSVDNDDNVDNVVNVDNVDNVCWHFWGNRKQYQTLNEAI